MAVTYELRISKVMNYCTATVETEYISKDSDSDPDYDIYTIEAGTQVTVSFTPVEGGTLNGNTMSYYDRLRLGKSTRVLGENGVYTFSMPEYNIWIRNSAQSATPPPPAAPVLLSAEPNTLNTVLKYTYSGIGTPMIHGFYREAGSGAEWTQSNRSVFAGADLTVVLPKDGVEYEVHVKARASGVWSAESNILTVTQPFVNVSGVTLNRTAASMGIGDANTIQLVPTVAPSYASNKTIASWTSDNEAVATVTNTGLITGVSAGTANITVTTENGSHTASCAVTVKDVPDTPANGSMVFGTADTTYDENGVVPAEVTLAVTIPTSKAVQGIRFLLSSSAGVTAFRDIKYEGQSFLTNTEGITIEDLNFKAEVSIIGRAYNVTAADGTSFLEAGKTYIFDLTFDVLNPAASPISVGFDTRNSVFTTSNYPASNSIVSLTPDERTPGTINVIWNGSGDKMDYVVSADGVTTYSIDTQEQFLWFADEVNGGNADIAAILRTDLDLRDTSFDGIGTREKPYTRGFSGGGHTVTYDMKSSDGEPAGFIRSFKGIAATDFIGDITVKGTINVVSGSPNVGGVAGEVDHEGPGSYTQHKIISNCISEMTINVSAAAGGNIGGIVGYATCNEEISIKKEIVYNTHLGTINVLPGTAEAVVGGIVGRTGDVSLIFMGNGNGGAGNALTGMSGGNITGRSVTGGIAGYIYKSEYLRLGNTNSPSDNTNFGAVSGAGSSSLGSATGGIIGIVQESTQIGGDSISGIGHRGLNMNFGTVSGSTLYVGGIAGYIKGSASIVQCNYNEGAISSSSAELGAAAGGIIGGAAGGLETTIKNNVNKGSIAATNGASIGAIIGHAKNGLDETGEKVKDNYFAIADGLSDSPGITGKNAQNLNYRSYIPGYSGTGGAGTAEDPFLLATDEDIAFFSTLVSTGASLPTAPDMSAQNAHVRLANDIDMSGYPSFVGIGTLPSMFSGTFDGGGHKVKFNIVSTEVKDVSMFGYCNAATVKNLTISGTISSGGNAVALVSSISDGTIENVTNEATITASGSASGIIGSGQRVTIKNLTNNGKVTGGAASGIVGGLTQSALMDGCVNNGDILANDTAAAGLVGDLYGLNEGEMLIVKNCVNNGRVESKSGVLTDSGPWAGGGNNSYRNTAGGIVGVVSGPTALIDHCTNNGDVLCSGNNAGGIVGCAQFGISVGYDLTITNSKNNGDIISTYAGTDDRYVSVGGILGNAIGTFDGREDHTAVISDNQNTGSVTGPEHASVGSIVGRTEGIFGEEPENEFDFSQGNTTTVINGGDADNPDVVYVGSDSGGPVVPVDPGNGDGSHESPGVVAPGTPTPENPAFASNTRYVSRPAATPREIDAGERPETLRVDEQIADEEVPQAQEPPADNSLDAGVEDIERAVENSAFTFVAIGIGVAAVAGFVLSRVSRNRRRA